MTLDCLGLITAHGSSKGIPRKNIRTIAGRPLIAWTIGAARASWSLTRLVTPKGDAEIAETARKPGCEVVDRPGDLAEDATPTLPVVRQTIDRLPANEDYSPDIIVVLHSTAPLRQKHDIDRCGWLLADGRADSVVSVTRMPAHYHPSWQTAVNDWCLVQLNGSPLSAVVTRQQRLEKTYFRNWCGVCLLASHPV